MKFCTNCGAELQESDKFCWKCGQQVEEHDEETEEMQEASSCEASASSVTSASQEIVADTENPAQPKQETVTQQEAEEQQEDAQQTSGEKPPVPPVYNSQTAGGDPYRRKPTEVKPGNKNVVLLAIISTIALIAILAVVITALFSGNKEHKPQENGKYYGTSCLINGVEAGAEDEWIDLQKKNRVTLFINGESYQGTWELDGEELLILQGGDEFRGTVKDGTLKLDINEMEYTFQMKPGSDMGTPSEQTGEAGYWTLLRVESDDPDLCIDEELAASFRDIDMEIFVNLEENGTGVMFDFLPREITWDTEALWDEGECFPYSLTENELTVEIYGDSYVFVRGTGEPPFTDMDGYAQNHEDIVDLDWWDGEWYGWWVVADASADLEDIVGRATDCCAVIDTFQGNTGHIKIFDTDCVNDQYLAMGDVRFGSGTMDCGSMFLESGDFMGMQLKQGGWYVDPGMSIVSDIDNMVMIEGEVADPENEDSWFRYEIYLRPWGTKWEDVRSMDTTDMPFDDMMPILYDSWYLPLIDAGSEMPSEFQLEE